MFDRNVLEKPAAVGICCGKVSLEIEFLNGYKAAQMFLLFWICSVHFSCCWRFAVTVESFGIVSCFPPHVMSAFLFLKLVFQLCLSLLLIRLAKRLQTLPLMMPPTIIFYFIDSSSIITCHFPWLSSVFFFFFLSRFELDTSVLH